MRNGSKTLKKKPEKQAHRTPNLDHRSRSRNADTVSKIRWNAGLSAPRLPLPLTVEGGLELLMRSGRQNREEESERGRQSVPFA